MQNLMHWWNRLKFCPTSLPALEWAWSSLPPPPPFPYNYTYPWSCWFRWTQFSISLHDCRNVSTTVPNLGQHIIPRPMLADIAVDLPGQRWVPSWDEFISACVMDNCVVEMATHPPWDCKFLQLWDSGAAQLSINFDGQGTAFIHTIPALGKHR
jgi:hypothetical protein